MTESALAAWLARLEAQYPQPIKLGLERVAAVANTLGLLPVSVPVVTVAGTNGKGSVVATIEALLHRAGVAAGVYTSPHLLRFNERIRINGDEAADSEIVAALDEVEAARGEVALSYFEYTTLAALLLFRSRAVEVVVLEVGLGGRLDAVNIVDPTIAVITSIALDHQEWLGDSLDQIAREKAGILRAGRPAVIAATEPPGLLAAVKASGAEALWLQRDFGFAPAEAQWRGWLQTSAGERRQLRALENPSLLPANLCAALQVLELLGLPATDAALEEVVPALRPPGRRQRLSVAGLELILDVAHNPSAVDKMVEFIDITPCNGKTIAVFSAMADKDIKAMIDAAGERFAAWFLADQPGNARAASAAAIAALLREAGQEMISVSKNLRQALARARSVMAPGDRLVVFGSFHTVAAALSWLAKEQGKG
ncbi:Mur ligase family protein [Haliea sp. E1-2-M8]|uniref:bifunctional folylpolyglutamate synthase/dihydrofolate synthase n=1 Tax=Haliea sp. E1-2-M8 TaxID=3064706 RepID=UPI0027162BD8|nr:Mur ligase family protein [Haliea sp. E1-2-M8]MDO8862890.1 Mur ligase family protein [Haliea sp. E1-2-M8]